MAQVSAEKHWQRESELKEAFRGGSISWIRVNEMAESRVWPLGYGRKNSKSILDCEGSSALRSKASCMTWSKSFQFGSGPDGKQAHGADGTLRSCNAREPEALIAQAYASPSVGWSIPLLLQVQQGHVPSFLSRALATTLWAVAFHAASPCSNWCNATWSVLVCRGFRAYGP